MKKLLFTLLILFVFSISAYAQMGSDMTGGQKGDIQQGTMMGEGQQMPMMNCPKMQGQGMMMHGSQQMPMMNCPKMQQMQGQGMMMQGGQQMPMMQMCMPMMQQMMGQGMMTRDMMQMMMNMMKMQEKIVKGVSPTEKKEMLKEIDRMMERLDRMMSDMRCSCKMLGSMMEPPAEPAKKVQEKEEPMQKEVPKTDPHGH